MFFKVVIVILLVLLIGVFINMVEDHEKYKKISFKETMDLLNVPIISFLCNGKKLHFLLDSGSSYSHISPEAVTLVGGSIEKVDTIKTIGAGSSMFNSSHCVLKLKYNDEIYSSDFIITEQLTQQLDAIKRDFNIEIHGVLGGDFLNRYNYVMDFKELVAYSRMRKQVKGT